MNNEIAGPWWHVLLGFVIGITVSTGLLLVLKHIGLIAVGNLS